MVERTAAGLVRKQRFLGSTSNLVTAILGQHDHVCWMVRSARVIGNRLVIFTRLRCLCALFPSHRRFTHNVFLKYITDNLADVGFVKPGFFGVHVQEVFWWSLGDYQGYVWSVVELGLDVDVFVARLRTVPTHHPPVPACGVWSCSARRRCSGTS